MCDNCGLPEKVGDKRVLVYKNELTGQEIQYRTVIKEITATETIFEVVEGDSVGMTLTVERALRPKRYVN